MKDRSRSVYSFFLFGFLLAGGSAVHSQTPVLLPTSVAEDRFEEMIVEISALPEAYSVKGATNYMVRPSGKDDEDTVVIEYVFELSVLSPAERRIAVRRSRIADTTHVEFVHFLRTNESRWFARSFDEIRMDVRELKKNERAPGIQFLNADMRQLPLIEAVALRNEYPPDYLSFLSQFKAVGARRKGDVVQAVYLHKSGLGLWVVEYGERPAWGPVRVSAYILKDGRDRWNDLRDPFEQLDNWRLTNSTASTWEHHGEFGYLPATVRIYKTPLTETSEVVEAEFVLTDWKFDKKEIKATLGIDRFTKERLDRYSYDELEKKIIAARNKKGLEERLSD